MRQAQTERNSKPLWGLILAASATGLIFHLYPTLTGIPELDGLLAVFLGFYICSQAAANFLNLILYDLKIRPWSSLTWTDVSWLGLNLLVLMSGVLVTVVGLIRFFSRAFQN